MNNFLKNITLLQYSIFYKGVVFFIYFVLSCFTYLFIKQSYDLITANNLLSFDYQTIMREHEFLLNIFKHWFYNIFLSILLKSFFFYILLFFIKKFPITTLVLIFEENAELNNILGRLIAFEFRKNGTINNERFFYLLNYSILEKKRLQKLNKISNFMIKYDINYKDDIN